MSLYFRIVVLVFVGLEDSASSNVPVSWANLAKLAKFKPAKMPKK